MKISLRVPTETQIARFLAKMSEAKYSYAEVGSTKTSFPEGYDHDVNRVLLGQGQEDFHKAKQLIDHWDMFSHSWTKIYPAAPSIEKGRVVAVLFKLFGFWWYNACRIVYTINDDSHYGFAYGTLEGHVEKGEEIFQVYIDEAEQVWFEIAAFSKPNAWYTRMTYPLPRLFQRRFVQGAFKQMKKRM